MRTTLTIDDDIARLVEQEVQRSGESMKGTVNRLLRLGLAASKKPEKRKPFKVKARPLGIRPGLSYDSIPELLEKIEGPYWR